MGKGSGGGKVEVVEYRMSMHVGVALEMDSVRRILVDEKVAWQGNVSNNTTLNINRPDLFGGQRKEGGLVGAIEVLMGRANQILPAQAAQRYKKQPNDCPAFRGLTTLMFRGNGQISGGSVNAWQYIANGFNLGVGANGFIWKHNSPVIAQKLEVEGTCAPKAAPLTQAYRMIPNPDHPSRPDANPAHIIYEILVDDEFGMGGSPDAIDVAAFEKVAKTLFDEKFGLSILWMRQSKIEDLVNEILQHIQATLFADPSTGLLSIKLHRDDYVVDDLFVVSPQNAKLSKYSVRSPGEIVNSITVSWTNPENEKSQSITAHDLASVANQGGETVPATRDYYGIRNAKLAREVLARDLREAAAPLISCEATLDRSAWHLTPGDVLVLNWPRRNLYGLVMRVGKVNYGSPGSSKVRVSLVQDIFSLSHPPIVIDPGTGWVDPSADPKPLTMQISTLPAYFARNASLQETPIDLVEPEVLAMSLADSQDDDSLDYELMAETPGPDGTPIPLSKGAKTMTPLAYLGATLPAAASSELPSTLFPDINWAPLVGGFVWLGYGDANQEIALVTGITETGWTIARGCLDTTPRTWAAGTPVWAVNPGSTIVDVQTIHAAGETVVYRGLDRTSKGQLAYDDAPDVSATLTERPHLPLRPANVKIGNTAFGSHAIGGATSFTISWATRNRLLEDTQVLAWTDGSVAPEHRQETVVRAYDAATGNLIREYGHLWTETSLTFQKADFARYGSVRFEVLSRRDDLESLTGHTITVTGFAANASAPDAPEAPGRTPPPSTLAAPGVGAFTSEPANASSGSGIPVIRVSGKQDNPDATGLVFRYREKGEPGDWSQHPPVALNREEITFEVSAIQSSTEYLNGVAYVVNGLVGRFRDLPDVITGGLLADDIFNVGGRPVTDVLALIDANKQAVADLGETYGDTLSAAQSAASAAASEAAAIQAKADALIAQGSAQGAASAAAADALAAAGSAGSASSAKTAAEAAKAAAETAKAAAETARTDAQTARGQAQAAVTAADAAKSDAIAKAQEAAGSASTAAGHASTATTKADEAAGSATAAAGSATVANSKAGEASTFASNAATSATNAAGSASSAATEAGLAVSARDAAQGHASAASTSASTASTKATEAGTSASAANTAKTAAETAKGQAETFATNAASSAQTASGHASNASISAGAAATSAQNAGNSASAASTAAQTAGTKATEAGNSASAAAASAVSAHSAYTMAVIVAQNSGFEEGLTGWVDTYSQSDVPVLTGTVVSNFEGRAEVLVGSVGQRISARNLHKYRVYSGRRYRLRSSVFVGGTGPARVYYGTRCLDAAGTPLSANNGHSYRASPILPGGSGWDDRVIDFTTANLIAGTTHVQVFVMANYENNAEAQVALDGIWLEDVTDVHNAEQQASAAASSASNAATSAGAAGSSATAAQTSATNAATSAGQASTHATNASTSAQTASGHASNASTSAGAAATSAQNAGNSASAAAGSASNAATSATNAGNSASAAAASAVSAQSSYSAALAAAVAGFPDVIAADLLTAQYNPLTAPHDRPSLPAGSVVDGTYLTSAGQALITSFKQYLPWETGAVYDLSAEVEALPNTTTGYAILYGWRVSSSYTKGNDFSAGGYVPIPAGTSAQLNARIALGGAVPGAINVAHQSAAFVNLGVLLNRNISGSAQAGAHHRLKRLTLRNVTALVAAEQQASAAATSASSAATSAGAAGSSASAAQTSATNAATSAGAASTSATNASNSAQTASGHASTASTQATNAANSAIAAGNSAGAASGSASTAATHATNAGNSAAAAAASSVSATSTYDATRVAASSVFPEDFSNEGATWLGNSWQGSPASAAANVIRAPHVFYSFPTVSGVGKVLELYNSAANNLDVATLGTFTPVSGRRYRITARYRLMVDAPGGTDVPKVALYFLMMDSGYVYTTASSVVSAVTVAQGWVEQAHERSGDQLLALTGTGVICRPMVRFYAFGVNNTYQLQFFRYEDITESFNAGQSATAAATSASNASTSAGAAGSSASAAQQSATNAATSAGAASTSATNASNSATTAAGHASNASTSATNAANSATAAGNSASAASGSASTAGTHATNAGNSAAAAQASRVAAESAFNSTVIAGGNSGFEDGLTGWWSTYNGAALGGNIAHSASFSGRSGVALASSGTRGTFFTAKRFVVDPARKYRVRSRIWTGPGAGTARHYVGFRAMNADGNTTYTNNQYNGASYQPTDAGSGWTEFISPNVITGEAPGTYSFYPGTTQVSLMAYLNFDAAPLETALDGIWLEDVTESENAAQQASAAATSASNASTSAGAAGSSASAAAGSATTAATRAGEALTYRNQASTSAGDAQSAATAAGTSATNAAGSATTAATQASNASASAVSAASSATLAVSMGNRSLAKNSAFANWAGATGVPVDWLNGNLASGNRVAGEVAQYAYQMAGPAGQEAYAAQIGGAGSWAQGQCMVVEAHVRLDSGSLVGSGVRVHERNSSGTALQHHLLPFATDVNNNTGAAIGAGAIGRTYRFAKLFRAAQSSTNAWRIDPASHLSSFGSIAAANNLTWFLCSIRPATPEEILANEAIPGMQATIAATSAVAIDAQGKANAAQTLTLDVNGYVSGTRSVNNGTKAGFEVLADVFAIRSPGGGERTEYREGNWHIYSPTDNTRTRYGKAFGGTQKLTWWTGPTSVAEGAETKANAYVYISQNTVGGPRFGGSDAPVTGGGGTAVAKPITGTSGSVVGSATIANVVAGSLVTMRVRLTVTAVTGPDGVSGRIDFEEGTGGTWTLLESVPADIPARGLQLPNGTYAASNIAAETMQFGARSGSVTYRATFVRTGGDNIAGNSHSMIGTMTVTPPAA